MTAPRVAAPRIPPVGWLLANSLWLLPVLFGFGTTTWIGFAIVGLAAARMRWIVASLVAFGALLVFEIDVDEALYRIERFLDGRMVAEHDLPLIVLYAAGVGYAIHVERVWLRLLWERKTGGRKRASTGTYHRKKEQRPAVRTEPTRAEMEARAARAFRTVIAREEQRAAQVLAAAASARPTTEYTPTPLPTSAPLVSPSLPVSSTLGLPRGPVDVRTATVDEIAAIPAIGPERAALIVASRGVRSLDSVDDIVELLDLPASDELRARPYLRF